MTPAGHASAAVGTRASESTPFDVNKVRADFPALHQDVNGHPLVYLDNGASTQKPQVVIDTIARFYSKDYANIHRGVHTLSQRSTSQYEAVRGKVQRFINAADEREIVMTSGTTDGINLVAYSFVRPLLRAGDEVLVTHMEHHSNIVPWQIICQQAGAALKVVPINDRGELDMDQFHQLLSDKTRIVAFVHVSNALGTINPIEDIIAAAHARKVPVLVDGAQAVAHMPVDVRALDVDFYAFSGHKLFGPTGTGVLYGKLDLLESMGPWKGGGDMIDNVTFEETTFAGVPSRFEAGTPNIAGVIGLGAAIDYVESVGLANAMPYEAELLAYATAKLKSVEGLHIVGTAAQKASVISFIVAGIHPHDVGSEVDKEGVAVRVGHHCAQPVMDRYEIPATTRASFAFYNTKADVDALVAALKKLIDKKAGEAERAKESVAFSLGFDPDYFDNYGEYLQELISSHEHRPRNRGAIEHPSHEARGNNPLCGDKIRVQLTVEDGVVKDVKFDGEGCGISTASASMMTQYVTGKTIAEVDRLFNSFHTLLTDYDAEPDVETLEKLAAFTQVRNQPLRVKCATLSWHVVQAALNGRDSTVSTEKAVRVFQAI